MVFIKLTKGGIEKVVLTADTKEELDESRNVLNHLPEEFSEVIFFQDPGLGFTGLPYQTKHLLDSQSVLECGHDITEPSHYGIMDTFKNRDNIVMSGTQISDNKSRPTATKSSVYLPSKKTMSCSDMVAVGTPAILDHDYIEVASKLKFNSSELVNYYNSYNDRKGPDRPAQPNLE